MFGKTQRQRGCSGEERGSSSPCVCAWCCARGGPCPRCTHRSFDATRDYRDVGTNAYRSGWKRDERSSEKGGSSSKASSCDAAEAAQTQRDKDRESMAEMYRAQCMEVKKKARARALRHPFAPQPGWRRLGFPLVHTLQRAAPCRVPGAVCPRAP